MRGWEVKERRHFVPFFVYILYSFGVGADIHMSKDASFWLMVNVRAAYRTFEESSCSLLGLDSDLRYQKNTVPQDCPSIHVNKIGGERSTRA